MPIFIKNFKKNYCFLLNSSFWIIWKTLKLFHKSSLKEKFLIFLKKYWIILARKVKFGKMI